jgi:cytochrome c peroxidase
MMKKIFLGIIVGSIIIAQACKPDPSFEPAVEAPFEFTVPQGWPTPFYNYSNNPLSKQGFELGRKLFYDTRLSKDNTVSCGSCHQQFSAFAQIDHPVSHGVNDLVGNRNSPALFNLNWHTSFFWDGGVNHIENQPIAPIQNPVEMDETMANVVTKLQADATYRSMFKAAFGDESVTSQRIAKAFAQFMGMMVSSNAKYDKYKRGESGGAFTQQELDGYDVYKQNCAACHTEPLFTDFSYRNNGLPQASVNDSGRAHITLSIADLYKFKVPSLRNLKYTWPYMHDGRFNNIDQVLSHYASGILQSPTLDARLATGIQLTDKQKEDLKAFLNTLNDEVFVANTMFQEVK